MAAKYDNPAGVEGEHEPGSNREVLKNLKGVTSKEAMDELEILSLIDVQEHYLARLWLHREKLEAKPEKLPAGRYPWLRVRLPRLSHFLPRSLGEGHHRMILFQAHALKNRRIIGTSTELVLNLPRTFAD